MQRRRGYVQNRTEQERRGEDTEFDRTQSSINHDVQKGGVERGNTGKGTAEGMHADWAETDQWRPLTGSEWEADK